MNTHGDCSFWDIVNPSEWFWGVSSCESVQINKSCATVDWWRWLIKSNVSSSSDTKNLDINSTIGFNLFLVIFTKLCDLSSFNFSIGNVHILFWDVNMMEKIVPHVKIVRFRIIVFNWVIFIKIESDDVLEWKTFLLVKSYQLSVQKQRCATCCKTKYKVFTLFCSFFDGWFYDSCDFNWSLLSSLKETGFDFLNEWEPFEWRKVFVSFFYLDSWSNFEFFSFHVFIVELLLYLALSLSNLSKIKKKY